MAKGKIELASFGGLRFYIYRREYEVAHIHVEADGAHCKIFLGSMKVRSRYGFTDIEIYRIQRWINRHREVFIKKWEEIHGQDK